MKKHPLVSAVFILFICFALSSPAFGGDPLKVKGFSIGMNIEEALSNFERLGFEGLTVRENKYRKTKTYYSIIPGSGDPFRVETGFDNKSVSRLFFSANICDRLFQTKNIGAEVFKDAFMKAYDIQEMKPYKDNPGSDMIKGWEHYNLQNGYRIRIDTEKGLEIVKSAKASEFSFD